MTHRQEKLESTLQRVISKAIATSLSDPRVRGLVSITNVRVTDDRKTAVVDVSVLPAEHAKLTLQALRHARKHLRTLVRDQVYVRPVPHLDFRLDESLKKQAEVLQAIRDSIDETEQNQAGASEDADAGDDRETREEPSS